MRDYKNTKIAVIIPSLQDKDYLELCLRSLSEHTKVNYEVKVHLNTFDAAIEEVVYKYDKGFTKSLTNLGIAPAVNICFDRTDSDFILFVDSDCVFLPDWDTYILEAMNKFGDTNIYPLTKIHPNNIQNKTDVVKNYGTSIENFDYQKLLKEVDSLRRPRFQNANCTPACVPRHLHVPFDEEYFPGWCTDAEMHVNAWHLDKSVRFIKSEMSLMYHFKSISAKIVFTDEERSRMCNNSSIHFNNKWGAIYPGMNTSNYNEMTVENYGGYIE